MGSNIQKKYLTGNSYDPMVYKNDEFSWQEGDYTVYRSTQWTGPGCHDGCGVLFYVKDGKVAKVEGDPTNQWSNGALCMRCLDGQEAFNAPNRLQKPAKRDRNERGKNTWVDISWEEAYDILEEQVRSIQEEYGSRSIVSCIGTGRNTIWQYPAMHYAAFQSPNFCGGFLSGDSCYSPRNSICTVTCSDLLVADFSQFFPERYDSEEWVVPECSVIWGNNPIVSNGDGFLGHWIVEAMKRGTELVVVDPRLTWMAAKAKYWLPIRPATDAALGMAFINVIAEEDLVDHEFIDLWCYGYEELVDACREWTPERAAEVCWVKADDIRAAARFMATAKPMNIQWGLAIDQQISSTPAGHCILALSAITGNVDVPGGNVVLTGHAYDLPMFPGSYINYIPESERDKRLGMNIYPFRSQSSEGMGLPSVLLEACESNGERSDAIEKYPIKMIFFCGNDPIACMGAEAPRIYETLNKIDFICVSDYQHTPLTMASADLVLPCSMGPERNSLRAWWWPLRSIAKVTEFADTRSDEQIMVDVINRLNPDAAKGIETDVDWLNWMLDGSGYDGDFEKLKKEGVSWPKWEYRKHEKGLVRSDGGLGFRTPSGRFNLKVDYFESLGLPTVPYYDEPKESPYSSPELYQEYPLILMTGRRSWEFFHSEHRNMPTMREFHPDPLVEVSPELAEDLELLENDWVWIENHRGRCRQRVKITPGLNPKFVMAEHAWWIPEADPENLYDVFEHNINNLTTQAEIGRSGYGAPYSGLLCKIYKCTEENSKISPSEQVLKKGGWKYERKHIEFD